MSTESIQHNDSNNQSNIEAPKSRLIIHKIIVENFKSYAGVREIGPFHKSFTSIVGPNGSGKSNVIDAIQFVFGKRGNKIRLKKLSELIHKSEEHPNFTYAKVSIIFYEIEDKEGDDYEIIEGSKLVVSRTVNKKSSSKYYINDSPSSFNEVTSLLKSKGIDLEHNRFLILQGEVEQIALMKPKATNPHEEGFLEYIEDIIGTNKYKPLIEEAEKKVEDLNEQRVSKLNSVRAAEREKESLEGAKNEAMEFLEKKRKWMKYRIMVYQISEAREHEMLKEVSSKREELVEKLEEETKKLNEASSQAEEVGRVYKQYKKERDKVYKQMEKSKSEFSSYERKDVKLTQDLKNNESRIEKLQSEIESTKAKIEANKKKIERSEKDEAIAMKQIEKIGPDLQSAEATVEKIYESIQGEIGPIRVKLEEKQKELLPWSKKLNEIKQQIDIAQSEVDLVKHRSVEIENKIEETKSKIEQSKQEHQQKLTEKASAQRNAKQIMERIPKLENELKQVEVEEKKADREYQRERTKYEEMKERLTSAKDRGALYKAIMNQKSTGAIKGICDRLGNLGTIDKKYDIAISTACPQLNDIVVETTEAGKKCVEFLRKENLGRATFIMIDKVKHLEERAKRKISTPEGVPRLVDLINLSDKKFLPAFYYALGDTLVAKDLEQASRIAYNSGKRYRVVTLKGELIEMSGTMSGGGTRIQQGGMAASFESNISGKQFKEQEKIVQKCYETLIQLRQRKENLSQQLKSLEEGQSKIELELSKLEMDEKAIEIRIKDLSKRLKELEKQPRKRKEDEERIEELNEQINKYKKEMKKAEVKYNSIQEQIQELQDQINDAGGEKLKRMKEKVEVLTKELEALNHKVTKLQVQRSTAQKAIPKLEKQIKQAEKEIEKILENSERAKKEKEELEHKAAEVYKSFAETQKILLEHEKELTEKEQQYEILSKKVDEIKEIEVELRNKLEDLDKLIKEKQKKANQWTRKIEQLEEQIQSYEDVDQESNEETQKKSYRVSQEELENLNEDKLNFEITILETEMEKMNPNMNAIKDYKAKERLYQKRLSELEQVTEERNKCQKEYEELRKKRLEEFMKGFSVITMKLKEIYQMVTLGGDAELELVDSLDPFSEGIIFSVRPPKKSWKNICNLSGGEKTLSSLALVFALHHYKPTPIYVMDEIDAALDFRNVSIIAHYIKQRTKNAQFIIISLRNNMFEMADILVGIYKTHNVTKSVCLNPRAVQQKQLEMRKKEEEEKRKQW